MIWAALAFASPIRVAFFGTSLEATTLSSLLGRGYEVSVFFTESDLRKYSADYVIVGVQRKAPSDPLDTFVPRLKQQLREFENLPNHPTVLLQVATPRTDLDRQVILPLTVQAARESGVRTFESGDGSNLGFAESLYFQIVDWKAAKAGWKIVSADSEQADEGPAKNAIDGDPNTYWHTQYSPTTAKYPHELIIDMGTSRLIGGFRYVPRQDGGVNGRVKKYEFEVSQNGIDWGAPVATGDFVNSISAGTAVLKSAVRARFIKFRALSEQNGNPYASMAELDVLPAKFARSD